MTAYPIPADASTPCRDLADKNLMFADRKSAPRRLEQAKRVCDPCGWRDGCLSWALTHGEEGVWSGTDEGERKVIAAKLGIVPERPTMNLPRTVSAKVPHGTAVGVEVHRKRYMPLCDLCATYDQGRQVVGERVPCRDCGAMLLPASMAKHRRRSCPGRAQVAS